MRGGPAVQACDLTPARDFHPLITYSNLHPPFASLRIALQQARLLPEQPRKALYGRPGFRNFEEQASAALESLPKDKAFQDTLIFFGLMCAASTNIRRGDQSHHGQPQTQPEQDDSDIVIVVNSWVIASIVRLSLSKYVSVNDPLELNEINQTSGVQSFLRKKSYPLSIQLLRTSRLWRINGGIHL